MKKIILILIIALTSCNSEHFSEKGEMICRSTEQGASGKCIYKFSNGIHNIELATKCGNYNIGDTLK